jgi:DNA-binding HxlR family transcriptional regulator
MRRWTDCWRESRRRRRSGTKKSPGAANSKATHKHRSVAQTGAPVSARKKVRKLYIDCNEQTGTVVKSPDLLPKKQAFVREMLERIADKWTLLVIDALEGEKEMRFTRLQERVGGISQKMLTRTLRQLERDGLVTRRVHATVPPRVEYRLTPLGVTLGESICGLWIWVEKNMDRWNGRGAATMKRRSAGGRPS